MTRAPARPLIAIAAVALCACLAACSGRGREVFVREGCVNCHSFKGLGGGPGPDLTRVGSRMSAAAMRARIRNPAALDPSARMPAFPGIGWLDLRLLVWYLRD